jgi:type IX secretion system PorP/SprF family membrane protein
MKKIYTIAFAIICLSVSAQDVHFSQYFATPLTFNPAYTANVNGMFRASFIYRNQWFNIPSLNSIAPYQTFAGSFDAPILRERLENDAFGFGGTVYADKAGNGPLSTINTMFSVAYHKAVDRYGRARLGLGISAGFYQKRIDPSNLIFESQFDGVGWNPSLNSGENFANTSFIKPDVNVGTLWSHAPKDNYRYYVGFSCVHVATPRESFLNDTRNRLNRKFVVNGGMEIFLNRDYTLSISPTVLFMLQSQAQQYNVGFGVNYAVNDNVDVFGGAFYRVKDAAIFNLGVEVYNARLGFSYDINHSELRGATKAQGALEVSLVYIFKKEKPQDIQYEKYCPNF